MIVTLLTDFGSSDYFVAAMKAVILGRNPDIRIVDVSHDVPRHDIEVAAFLLLAVYADFPAGTVHTVVVDPDVGSSRRAIAAHADGRFLVGPDNGVLGWALERADRAGVRSIDEPALRRGHVSSTFHGRDLFAPTAASLATGFPFDRVGEPVDDWVRAPDLAPDTAGGEVRGRIIHIDGFGNCITNLTPADLRDDPAKFAFQIGDRRIDSLRDHFAEGRAGEPFMIVGSAGFLEIAVGRGSAAELLGVSRGTAVTAAPR